MAAFTTGLPSTVEEHLAACPQLRILVVGNSGVGKSSLISSVFNISLRRINTAYDHTWNAGVGFAYTSDENPRFILHDSQGIKPGATNSWHTLEQSLRARSAAPELQVRCHAIWLCIEVPRAGLGRGQTGEERLLILAKECRVQFSSYLLAKQRWLMYKKVKIPAIVVFTKFDLLMNEHLKAAQKTGAPESENPGTSRREAEEDLKAHIESCPSLKRVPCVRISTKPDYLWTAKDLLEATRQGLQGVEGELWLPWATAQQLNASQKVEASISEGHKKYWIDLGQSTVFQGYRLVDCLSRISQDVLKTWNFNDPNKLLSGPVFFAKTIQFVEEFSPSLDNDQEDWLSQYSDVGSLASAIGSAFEAAFAVDIGLPELKYIYRTYEAIPATAQYLGAYIIDLTLVLHRIFIATLKMESPRIVSRDLVEGEVRSYKDLEAPHVHRRIRRMRPNVSGFEQEVTYLIRESLG